MKVLHLSSEKGWRGGEQQIAYLLDELAKSGVENVVLARKGSDFEKYCQQKAVPVYGVSFSSSVDIRTAKAIKTVCLEHGIDLVHMHSAKSHSLAVLSATMGNPVPLVLSRRVNFAPSNSWFTRWKYNHDSIRRIICVSDKINSIMSRYLQRPEKSVTVHSGIDITRFKNHLQDGKLRRELGLSDDTFLVGNTSAMEAEKDYPTFVRTIATLVARQIPVTAVVMGSGSKESELKTLVNELSLTDRVLFTGYRRDVPEILPGLDVFLMTSREEGLGTSVLDAFAANVAVVATQAGGIPEMVLHERTGLLAPIGNAELLAANVERLWREKEFRGTLVKSASAMLGNFTKEKTAEKTLKIYKEVLSEQS